MGFASGVSRDGVFKPAEEKDGDLGDANYDEFSGYGGSLFASGTLDPEDNEADRIYDLVDSRMEGRRKKARDQRNAEDIEVAKSAFGFQKQFTDYKKELCRVSEEEWMALPDAQERLKAKKVKREFLQAVPDRIIAGSGREDAVMSGEATVPASSMTEIGEAKQAVLSVNLAKEESALNQTSSVNAEGYLSQLTPASAISDIAEIKKARLLFRSITRSDPKNATAWLASARLEEVAGNVPEAKAILAKGLSECKESEELWLGAVRLEANPIKAKSIIANGIRANPKSVVLWTQAAQLEESEENKKKVFQKSLELIPHSDLLWKSLINLSVSNSAETLLLLARAVECCPSSEDLWLALAKLTPEIGATQKILNDARRAIPTSARVWVAAAELAAASMNVSSVEGIVRKAIESLGKNGVVLERREWLDLAASSEKRGCILVAEMIVKVVITSNIENLLQHHPAGWVKHQLVFADAEYLGASKTAEAVLATAVYHSALSGRKGIWIRLLQTRKTKAVFEHAVQACPLAEVLWLMFAKFVWTELGDPAAASNILQQALLQIDNSEDMYLAAVKLADAQGLDVGGLLLTARRQCPSSARVWVKSAQVERQRQRLPETLEIVEEGILRLGKNSSAFKLFLIAAHANVECSSDYQAARDWAARACAACPTKAPVWLVAADVAESDFSRARSILERGRLRLPNDESLWWRGLQVELASGADGSGVKNFLARALQACPTSGLLWSWAISLEPPATRHPKCLDALKRCQDDPLVVGAVARFFWLEKRQIDKARKWFQNCIPGSGFGQIWADFLAFELSQGDANLHNLELLLTEISSASPTEINKGIEWNMVTKKVENWPNSGKLIQNLLAFIRAHHPAVHHQVFVDQSCPRLSALIDAHLVSLVKKQEQE